MSDASLHRPDYGEGAPVRRRRRRAKLLVLAVALFFATGFLLVHRGVVTRIRLLYWQRRCAAWDGPVVLATTAGPVPWPPCFRSLWRALADSGCSVGRSFFDGQDEPVVFLHERTSHDGTRRLIAMEFRPNVSHRQLCSLDCLVLDPATMASSPSGTAQVAAWIPGFWSRVQLDQLQPAVADPADASHFVFSYAESVPVDPAENYFDFDPTNRPAFERRLLTRVVDGWLLDDGSVRIQARSDLPVTRPVDQSPPAASRPHVFGPMGPPRPPRLPVAP